jgi:hypothetical protein
MHGSMNIKRILGKLYGIAICGVEFWGTQPKTESEVEESG